MNEKVIVAVCVYNRLLNIERWLKCWDKCQKSGELVIIHNYDKIGDCAPFRALCNKYGVKYIPRINRGLDIGALQDICRERLSGFNNSWDKLIWCADDSIPMDKDFIQKFLDKFSAGVGCTCMEISKEVKLHIRTTGFCITKDVSRRLIFPRNPMLTKQDCYLFEHRGKDTLLNQIKAMGLEAVQICDLRTSPIWDLGNRLHLNRWNEFNEKFGFLTKGIDKVTFICPIYNRYPQIISSLINQTHENWELILCHDGINTTNLRRVINAIDDERITYIEHPVRLGNYGHPLRKFYLNEIKEGRIAQNTDYIVISNDDNFYSPIALEEALKVFKLNPSAIATYFSQFVHGYMSNQPDGTYRFGIMNTKLQLGFVDCGGVVLKKDIACEIGWNDMSHSSDWTFFKSIIDRFGAKSFKEVKGCHFVHV